MKIFILESPNPNDFLADRNEEKSLKTICKMFGHETGSLLLKNKRELDEALEYIARLKLDEDEYCCIHFSGHGNENGLGFGKDFVEWKELSNSLEPILTNKGLGGKYSIVISACGTSEERLTRAIEKEYSRYTDVYPPDYILMYDEDEISIKDSILGWSILYHWFENEFDKGELQGTIDVINDMKIGKMKYCRWDKKKGHFRHY